MREDYFAPAQQTWSGTGGDIQSAFDEAWANSQKDPNPPRVVRSIDIFATGTNPISEYSVILGRGG
jgi:hypothetical protein